MKHWIAGGILAALLLTGCSARGAAPADSLPAASQGDAGGGAAGESAEAQAYHRITAEEAKQRMDEGGVTVVDVRTEEEYREGHIPGAVLVPNETIGSEPPEALPDLDAVLLVHCRTGVRSKQAANKLVEMGYTQVYDFGGIRDWPYDIVTED
ncbi:rhodanese-like domain-containing protein [Allofournierella sp.]|uniref:rhodanese-like domain-containing protein n=1 Tax=Allofournierella sp. TaxID=1940256 RepID=UPI003AB3E731